MTSRTTERFRKAFAQLPASVQNQARTAYQFFRQNPQHPSLRFRQVHPTLPIYSARIGLHYRAVGVREGDEVVWFWVGAHTEYDRILAQL